MKTKELKNLGWQNGWKQTPEVVVECMTRCHQAQHVTDHSRCYTKIFCIKCGYTYEVDSSG